MNLMPDEDDPVPTCPMCERPMALSGVTPREGSIPEVRRFVCLACGEALTFSEDDETLDGRAT